MYYTDGNKHVDSSDSEKFKFRQPIRNFETAPASQSLLLV